MKQLIDKANTVALEQKMVETIGLELDIFRLHSENLAEKIINLISFQHYFVSTVVKSLLLGFFGFIAFVSHCSPSVNLYWQPLFFLSLV